MTKADKNYLAGLSRPGSDVVGNLCRSVHPLRAAIASYKPDVASALSAAADFQGVVDAIDSMGAPAASEGGGDEVPVAEAELTGTLVNVDPFGRIFKTTLTEALTDHVSRGVPFVIAGAGALLADLLEEIPAWMGQIGANGLIVQFVGIDPQHWSPERAVACLEMNLLQAAAAQVLNSAMNEAGVRAVVVSQGFGCWVANRALLGLPVRDVQFARNLEVDPLGSSEILSDLLAVKDGGFGTITHVQGKAARAQLSKTFGVSDAMLKSIPVDISA